MEVQQPELFNHKTIHSKHLSCPEDISTNRSTDNIFLQNRMISLHNIYNQFLVNPYLNRRKIFDLKFSNRNITNTMNNNYLENFQPEIEINNKKEQNYHYFNNYEDNSNTERLMQNNIENQRYNNNIDERQFQQNLRTPQRKRDIEIETNRKFYSPAPQEYRPSKEIQYQEYSNNNYNRLSPRTIYENELAKHNYPNNNQELQAINDVLEKKEFISPVITKIAKKNYLSQNPYSAKKETLGPTMLQMNPILYPIDSYKFDFDRYIRRDYVKKYN